MGKWVNREIVKIVKIRQPRNDSLVKSRIELVFFVTNLFIVFASDRRKRGNPYGFAGEVACLRATHRQASDVIFPGNDGLKHVCGENGTFYEAFRDKRIKKSTVQQDRQER